MSFRSGEEAMRGGVAEIRIRADIFELSGEGNNTLSTIDLREALITTPGPTHLEKSRAT